jgi:cytochrome b
MKNENTIQVWDILIRTFHWSLVVSFVIAYLTAEEENIWHIYSGYAVLGLIIFRVIWGLFGSKYARFDNFIYSPGVVIQYIKELIEKRPKHYVGHNPAGGYMIMALILSLFVVSVSGLKVYAVEEGLGPLALINAEITITNNAYADQDENNDGHDDHEEEFWEEIHEVSTNFTLFLIFLHIAGVLVSSRLHDENLVKAMITGKKKA